MAQIEPRAECFAIVICAAMDIADRRRVNSWLVGIGFFIACCLIPWAVSRLFPITQEIEES
jgi:hypothetical protein